MKYLVLVAVVWLLCTSTASAAIIDTKTVTYTGGIGVGGDASGLSATAVFTLRGTPAAGGTFTDTMLEVVLTNTSSDPNLHGGANAVLSGINWELSGSNSIVGGSAVLGTGSSVVTNQSGSWVSTAGLDLNDMYGYSNSGVGNDSSTVAIFDDNGIGPISGKTFVSAAVTAHSNGGKSVTTFSGVNKGGMGQGLDYSLVSSVSDGFGGHEFIKDSVLLMLDIDPELQNLAFLQHGTYVEFGSDYAYVGGEVEINSDIPEPTSLLTLAGLATCFGFGIYRRRSLGKTV